MKKKLVIILRIVIWFSFGTRAEYVAFVLALAAIQDIQTILTRDLDTFKMTNHGYKRFLRLPFFFSTNG